MGKKRADQLTEPQRNNMLLRAIQTLSVDTAGMDRERCIVIINKARAELATALGTARRRDKMASERTES